jgi:hypothetical protein
MRLDRFAKFRNVACKQEIPKNAGTPKKGVPGLEDFADKVDLQKRCGKNVHVRSKTRFACKNAQKPRFSENFLVM